MVHSPVASHEVARTRTVQPSVPPKASTIMGGVLVLIATASRCGGTSYIRRAPGLGGANQAARETMEAYAVLKKKFDG